MAACSQCGNTAVVSVGGVPLCVDCNLKLAQAQRIRDRALKERYNQLLGEAEALTGLYGVMPRYEIEPEVPTVVHSGPVNFHNIKVEGSVVGAINTGNVERIDVALSHIKIGDPELEKALAAFTEAVANSGAILTATKDEILEQLALVAHQAAAPRESRSWAILKAVAINVGTQLATAGLTDLIQMWGKIKPMLGL